MQSRRLATASQTCYWTASSFYWFNLTSTKSDSRNLIGSYIPFKCPRFFHIISRPLRVLIIVTCKVQYPDFQSCPPHRHPAAHLWTGQSSVLADRLCGSVIVWPFEWHLFAVRPILWIHRWRTHPVGEYSVETAVAGDLSKLAPNSATRVYNSFQSQLEIDYQHYIQTIS
jgi:hypothetical protein